STLSIGSTAWSSTTGEAAANRAIRSSSTGPACICRKCGVRALVMRAELAPVAETSSTPAAPASIVARATKTTRVRVVARCRRRELRVSVRRMSLARRLLVTALAPCSGGPGRLLAARPAGQDGLEQQSDAADGEQHDEGQLQVDPQ